MPLYALAPVVWFWKPPQRWTWIKELKNKDIYRHNTYIDKNTYIITLANMPIHPLGNWNCGWRLRWRGIGLETIPAIGVIIGSVHNLLLFGDALLSRGRWFIQEVFLLHSDPTIALHGLMRGKSSVFWVEGFALGRNKGKLALLLLKRSLLLFNSGSTPALLNRTPAELPESVCAAWAWGHVPGAEAVRWKVVVRVIFIKWPTWLNYFSFILLIVRLGRPSQKDIHQKMF